MGIWNLKGSLAVERGPGLCVQTQVWECLIGMLALPGLQLLSKFANWGLLGLIIDTVQVKYIILYIEK